MVCVVARGKVRVERVRNAYAGLGWLAGWLVV